MSNNLFNVLNFSDTEEVPEQQQKKSKKNNNNKEQIIPVEQVQKENTKHDNPAPKQKGVPSDPHPKDRQSGTGRGKEQRKEGGGRNNWGNYKDDLKEEKYVAKEQKTQDTPKQEQNEQTTLPVQPPAPEKTLADYYQQRGANVEDVLKKTETKPQVVKQIDEEALKKDKLFVMKTREDEKKLQEQKQKKTRQQQPYRSELNTQAAEYLGFTNQVQEPERKNERRGERRQYDKQEPVQEQQQQQQESETQVQGEKGEKNERENRQDRGDRQGDRQNKGYKRDRQDRPQHDRQNRDNNTRDQRRGDKQRRGDDRQDKKPQQRQQEQGIQLDDKDFPSL
ncbi:unnamed protein product [Paramecium pentaurelia]|uniref:Hyaluronan/mRNA-binding protein domain-containing protein n=1 Tax=Paramecium pentaurelia TaxID=43138 RepID=A0A8S1WIA5_9CILI|nr:unnamed protein product [Paramecium pentaurelia]